MLPILRPRPDAPPPETGEPLPCACCGFRAEGERGQAFLDGRARPVCSICDAALHLQGTNWGAYDLAWIPEIGQDRVSHLARTLLVADAIADQQPPKDRKDFAKEVDAYLQRCAVGGEIPREVFDAAVRDGASLVASGLKARAQHLRAMLGLQSAAEVVAFLGKLPPPTLSKVLEGLRVIPKGVYETTVRSWIEGGSPYAEIDGAQLHRMRGYVDA